MLFLEKSAGVICFASNFRGAQSHVWKAGSVDKSEGGVGRRREEGREEENTSLCPIHFSLMDYFVVVVWSFMQWEGRHQPSSCQIILTLEFRGTHINEVLLKLHSVKDHISWYLKRQWSFSSPRTSCEMTGVCQGLLENIGVWALFPGSHLILCFCLSLQHIGAPVQRLCGDNNDAFWSV